AFSSLATTASKPGAADAYASSALVPLLRAADRASIGCRRTAKWCGSSPRCLPIAPGAQPQRPHVSLPEPEAKQHDEHEEVDQRKERSEERRVGKEGGTWRER